jgi:hypothetical protein
VSAPRLVPLRRRGTNAQRYARLQKWCLRKASGKRRPGELPHLGIDYTAIWRARNPDWRVNLAKHVDITVTYLKAGVITPVEARECLFGPGKAPYTDHGIEVVRRAVEQALREQGAKGALVSAPGATA